MTPRLLLALAGTALGWGVIAALTGGIVLNSPFGRISSRDAIRPIAAAALIGAVYVLRYRRTWTGDVARLSTIPWARLIVAIAALATLIFGIRWGSFVAGGSDASGYVSQAQMWRRAELVKPAPGWARDATWPNATWAASPVGYRAGPTQDVIVPTYSPGLPLAMAAFERVGGANAVYYVVPLLGAVAVAGTYGLGAYAGGAAAGAAAALLLAASPIFRVMLVQPMSDVPATAFWCVALWLATRAGAGFAAGAGAATALAVATRANLAPLALVVGAIVLLKPGGRVRDAIAFAAAAAPAALLIAVLNQFWYGSPLRSGYGSLEELYAADRVLTNAHLYLGWLFESQTPLIAAGLLAPFVIRFPHGDRRTMVLLTIVFPVGVLALYLPYFVFEGWPYLRFLLPAFPPLLAAFAAVVMRAVEPLPRDWRAIAAAVLFLALVLHGTRYADASAVRLGEARFRLVAEHVARLPPRSVFVSDLHSGSISHYTGREILRWGIFGTAGDLDRALAYLQGLEYDLFLVVDDSEVDGLTTRFAGSAAIAAMTRPPRVAVEGVGVYALTRGRGSP